MNKILWEAKYKIKKKSNLYEYEKFLKKKYKIKLNCNFSKIHNWSIKNPERFWSSFWEYSKVKGKKIEKFKFNKQIFKSKFFIGSKLNFAENLFSKKDDTKAITFISENGYKINKSWNELYHSTSRIINFLKKNKIKKNDIIAAYLPNF